MELTFLRGACCILEANGKRILIDPWLEDGVYYGSWAHFPSWPQEDYSRLGPIDYIYVSHIHPDHFDANTMAKLQCKAPVLIHTYPTKFLKKHIEDLGFEVIECEHGKPFDLGSGVSISIFSADDCDPRACGSFFGCAMPGIRNTQIDSMAVITDGAQTVVNVNDCPWLLSRNLARKIAEQYPIIDLALIAYAGAGPYPQTFVMLPEQRLAEAQRKRREFLSGVVNFAKALRARRVFPFAGDYQLCSYLSELNEVRGVPEVSDVYRYLWQHNIKTLCLNPGENAPIDSPGHPIIYREDERIAYVQDVLSQRKLDYEDDPEPKFEDIRRLLQAGWERFNSKRKEYGLQAQATAYFRITNNGWFVVPPKIDECPYYTRRNRSPLDKKAGPFVELTTDIRMLKRLLMGPKHAHWNNAQIGSHIGFRRQPLTMYESGLYHLLSYFHA